MTGVVFMIIKYERTGAYICPFCSNPAKKTITPFNFSEKDKLELLCPTKGCKEKCVSITYKNKKYRFDIECPICSETHSYTLTKQKFWNGNVLSYQCPVSNINMFFWGNDKDVDLAAMENNDEYNDVLTAYGINTDSPDLLFEMVECVEELNNMNNIYCTCGNYNVSVQIINNSITLLCNDCKKVRVIEINEDNLAMLLNAEAIIIGK